MIVGVEGTLLEGLTSPIVARSGWGAEPPVDWPVERAPVRAVVVHHTATRESDGDLLDVVRRVQRFHAHDRGWGDIGYSLVILRDGRVVEGRAGTLASPAPTIAQAAHALSHNVGTVGVAVAGRYHDGRPSSAAWDALVDVVATIGRNAGLDPMALGVALANGRRLPAVVSGHRDACDTSCPGDGLASLLGELRSAAAERLSGPGRG